MAGNARDDENGSQILSEAFQKCRFLVVLGVQLHRGLQRFSDQLAVPGLFQSLQHIVTHFKEPVVALLQLLKGKGGIKRRQVVQQHMGAVVFG